MSTKTKVEKAIELYKVMHAAEGRLRAHKKLLIALPKHKMPKHLALHSKALVEYKNAQSKFQKATKGLSFEEFQKLRVAVYA